jgi:hypothetical protein
MLWYNTVIRGRWGMFELVVVWLALAKSPVFMYDYGCLYRPRPCPVAPGASIEQMFTNQFIGR